MQEKFRILADGTETRITDIKVRFTGKSRATFGTREITPAYEDGVESAELAWEVNNRQKTQLVIRTEEEAEATLKHLNRHLDRCEETGPYGTVWAAPGMAKAVRRVIETIESEMSGREQGEGEKSTEEPNEQSESESDDTPPHEIPLSDEAAAAIQTAFNGQEKYSTGRDYHPNNDPTVHVHDREMVIEVLEDYRDILEETKGEATLYDPNGKDEYLSWVRKALDEVSEDTEEQVMTDGGTPAEDWNCDDCGYSEKAPVDGVTGEEIETTVGSGRRQEEVTTVVCPECGSKNWHSESVRDALMTDGGEPVDEEYDVIWDLQKRWNLRFEEAEMFLEDIGYFDYLDNRYQYHLYSQFKQMLIHCNHGDLEGMSVYIDYLSASSGYETVTSVEGTIDSHGTSQITVYRDDGNITTVELVPGAPYNEYGRIDVRTNGRKVGKITEPEHEIHLFRDDQT